MDSDTHMAAKKSRDEKFKFQVCKLSIISYGNKTIIFDLLAVLQGGGGGGSPPTASSRLGGDFWYQLD